MNWHDGIIGAPQWVNALVGFAFVIAVFVTVIAISYGLMVLMMNRADRRWARNNARMFDIQAHEALHGDRDEK